MSDSAHAWIDDYNREPLYEDRVVIFYDVLGWKTKIVGAGVDREKIGRLRRMILQHVRFFKHQNLGPEVNATTFSDNVVISFVPGEYLSLYLQDIAIIQLISAISGFLIRGGITFGKVIHDHEVVFGPGLNRAYELESKIANYPRILIDETVMVMMEDNAFCTFEDGLHFLNPFDIGFTQFALDVPDAEEADRRLNRMGLPNQNKAFIRMDPKEALAIIALKIREQMVGPLPDKEWKKLSWLYDRIASQLGAPLSSSYSRVRPGDVVE